MGRHHQTCRRKFTNLGGACGRAMKLENVLRTRAPQQQPLSAEFVAVDSKVSARTRVGELRQ